MISFKTPYEVQIGLAEQLKSKRKLIKHSRSQAAKITGVPEPTIKKFERTGEISLRQFLMLAYVYGELSIYDNAFPVPAATTMDELIKISDRSKKKS